MKFMVVDGSPIAYQQFNAVGHLSTKGGIPTGLRFGFMRAIRSYEKKLGADRVVVCWDTKAPIKKAEGIAAYKANRVPSEAKDTMYNQLPDLQVMISLTHWSQAWADGYEADDVVGTITRKLVEQGHSVIVVTTDHDLMQLIGTNVVLYVPGKEARIKYAMDVVNEYGVTPEKLLYLRAMQGDTSDNLKGIALMAREKSGFKDWLAATDDGLTLSKVKSFFNLRAWDSLWGSYMQNYDVMGLQAPEKVTVQKGTRDKTALTELFANLEMKSLVARIDEFTGGPTVG